MHSDSLAAFVAIKRYAHVLPNLLGHNNQQRASEIAWSVAFWLSICISSQMQCSSYQFACCLTEA